MLFRKIMLKDDDGNALAALTIRPNVSHPILPSEFTVQAYLTTKLVLPSDGEEIFLAGDDLSMLGTMDGRRVFATTLPPQEAALAKWRLMDALSENSPAKVPKSPLAEPIILPENSEPTIDFSAGEECVSLPNATPTNTLIREGLSQQDSTEESTVGAPAVAQGACVQNESSEPLESEPLPETPLQKAKRLLGTGEPFHLFEEMMPNSAWALIREDDYEYLIGITEEEHVLYGIPGSRAYPPDEETLWTFFPTNEEGEGWFLTEAPIM